MEIVRCASCDGYGWVEDELDGTVADCDWCKGVGYVYRDEQGVDLAIPPGDYAAVSETLERLETERLRELGYTGQAKPPREQPIRQKRSLPDND